MVTFYFGLVVAVLIKSSFSQAEDNKVPDLVFEKDDHLYLKCDKGYNWATEGGESMTCGEDQNMGSLWNDPRGVYYRSKADENADEKKIYFHVFVRKCMNCIELNPGTIAGFVVADVVMIGLIALAVYFVSGSEMRRPARASDKQNLIENNTDTDYQVLGQRDNDQYSHLAPRPRRGGF
ncbi:T-cell surface glycoprotein CD3 gamma chain-like [Anomaloglossus baeobatrachus]|uniref:T-cell surface glycoprotein CD3 gamma chain-like n=1 Tax=Anomaloglossus baeobatrachus TaxID=238106 RepID=UPI003F50B6EB